MSVLRLRGPNAVYDGQWAGIPELPALNELLDSLLPPPLNVPEPEATATSAPE
jgi:hypothetical protein